MRNILFRGKQMNGTEWFYGDLSHAVQGDSRYYVFPPDGYNSPDYYEVSPETVGEYTGFNDKQGKKIFEGDIVLAPQSELFLEYHGDKKDLHGFINGEVLFEAGYILLRWREKEGKTFDESSISLIEPLEVVGNIFDNPELLEGGDMIAK